MVNILGYEVDTNDLIKGLDVAGNLFNSYNKSSTANSYVDMLKNSEIQKYNDTKAYNDALAAWQTKSAAAAASNRAASAAASNANSAAARKAAMQTDKNKKKAEKKANTEINAVYDKTMATYDPYVQMAGQLMPQMQKSYEGGLNTSALLDAYLKKPENMALLNGSTSAASSGPMLPNSLRR